MTDRDKLEVLQGDVFEYLEKLERQLQKAIDSIPSDSISAETMEALEDCTFSIACHADIFNSSEYRD